MKEQHVARRFYVNGTVQGVGYRYFVQRVATGLGVMGYAKNLPDGRVEVYAIGLEKHFADLRRQLQRGPASASVSDVSEEDAAVVAKYEHGFSIEFD
ncbi:MAG TPA: acylphosphatase [Candidatus Acidoferrales bacterium]